MNLCIVVPVYNCDEKIANAITSLIKETTYPILVIDDGSDQEVEGLLKDFTHRVKVIRHPENLGKGLALQTALHYCLAEGYSHMLSFDGDGQHVAREVLPMAKVSEANEKTIVIGARKFREGVPGISHFGRKFSNFWVYYQTGKKVSDSQSGMRIYPIDSIKDFRFFTKRYDFEIEVLVRSIWNGVPVTDVDVDVLYPKERVSHFHKLKDNARITGLNILLIAYSLIFYQKSFFKIILAGFFGSILSQISSVPLTLFLAVALSVLFRVNFILMCVVLSALWAYDFL